MRVLISGFEAFGGRETNPTAQLVMALQNNEVPFPTSLKVDQILLPVSFQEAYPRLEEKVNAFNPDVVIAFGEAHKRQTLELETTAVNEIAADIIDNLGEKPTRQKINPNGLESFSSTLPLQGFEGALKDAGISVKLSQSAGAFVCNHLFYRLMEDNQETFRLCGFIHVPLESVLPLDELKHALSVMLYHLDY
jgi:pyroglutamyl-peptidase